MMNPGYVSTARLVALAASLIGLAAAPGCGDAEDDGAAGAGGDEASSGGMPGGAGAEDPGPDAGRAGHGGSVAGDGTSAGGTPSGSGGQSAGGEPSSAGSGGSVDGGAGGIGNGGGAPVCDDSVGEPNCDGVTAACSPFCAAAVANAKSAVAVEAIACLALDTSTGCDSGYDCMAAATGEGCREDVATACDVAAQNCQTIVAGKPSCAQLLSGLNEEARGEMLLCLEQYCDSVWACAQIQFFESPP